MRTLRLLLYTATLGLLMTLVGVAAVREERDSADQSLLRACYSGDLRGVSQALAEGADPNAKDEQGRAALFWVVKYHYARSEQQALLRLLLDNGADPNSELGGGETAMTIAARYDQPTTMQLLIRSGGDWRVKNRAGSDAYMIAQREQATENLRVIKGTPGEPH